MDPQQSALLNAWRARDCYLRDHPELIEFQRQIELELAQLPDQLSRNLFMQAQMIRYSLALLRKLEDLHVYVRESKLKDYL